MFPNPQDALPLPPQPDLGQYKKLAKDLVKACKSGDGAAVHAWAERWVERLASLDERPLRRPAEWLERRVADVERFATERLAGRNDHEPCALTGAQFVVYGGGWTALGLVATSSPPRDAGVQLDVIDVLVDHHARMDRMGGGGQRQSLIRACLANGCPEAAAHLIARGAPLDIVGAAGTGHLELLRQFVADDRVPVAGAARTELEEAYAMAAAYGRAETVQFLLERGLAVDAELRLYGQGHTALHVASYNAHGDVVRLLLRAGARVDMRDKTWGTPPIIWALTGWSNGAAPSERYHATVAMLVDAGLEVQSEWLESEKVRADPAMRAALTR